MFHLNVNLGIRTFIKKSFSLEILVLFKLINSKIARFCPQNMEIYLALALNFGM